MQFNNYYNRIIKKYDTIDDYATYVEKAISFQNINFIPGDGIDTVQILNWTYDWTPDYIVVFDSDIVSRWFIINSERTRGQQYKLGLHRDIVVDNYSEVVKAPMFIEKGYLKNVTDPAVFNKENLTFNQIKKQEIPLSDDVGCAWLVAFFGADVDDFAGKFSDKTYPYKIPEPDFIIDEWTELPISQGSFHYFNGDFKCNKKFLFAQATQVSGINQTFEVSYDGENSWNMNLTGYTPYDNRYNINGLNPTNAKELSASVQSKTSGGFAAMLDKQLGDKWLTDNGYSSYSQYNNDKKYNGKIVKYQGKYYRIEVTDTGNAIDRTINVVKNSKYWMPFGDPINNGYVLPMGLAFNLRTVGDLTFTFKTQDYEVLFVQIPYLSGLLEVNTNNVNPSDQQMTDAPYCALAIPFKKEAFKFKYGSAVYEVTPEMQHAAISLFQYSLGDFCYDVQLLPYSPFGDSIYVSNDDTIDMTGVLSHINFTENGSIKTMGFLFYQSNISGTINKALIPYPNTPEEVKIENECRSYRLCAPQYTNVYEVSPMMNYGVGFWHYDCTYKPYQSYIHVAPQFKGLFGTEQDQRGLIITGSFSIPQKSSAWVNYVNSNKNYANIFDRGIKNLETQQKWERAEAISSAATGWIGSATTGFVAGGITGIPGANIAGSIMAGVGSAIGGAVDVAKTIEMQKESLNYTKDLYNYNLGNIQATPDTLKTVSAFDANTRLFPFVEVYSCSYDEEKALRNKIAFNGMSIGRIGTIAEFTDFTGRYVKGQLIRLEGSNNDSHELIALADELFKGVFI